MGGMLSVWVTLILDKAILFHDQPVSEKEDFIEYIKILHVTCGS